MKITNLKQPLGMIRTFWSFSTLICAILTIQSFTTEKVLAEPVNEKRIVAHDDTIRVQNENAPKIIKKENEYRASNRTLVVIDGVIHVEKNAMQHLDPNKSYITTLLTDPDSIKKYTSKKVEALLVITSQ